jgi:hypothetical protein
VRDLTVHDHDLVIATHGRGFYILDDVAALRQADAKIAGAGAWLYAPSNAVRVRRAEFTGTPLPKDEPMAPNPPDGAYIDYVLKTTPKAPVMLDILAADGSVVRHYSSDVKVAPADAVKLEIAPEWKSIPITLSVTPGMHRFVWPLRQAAPAVLAEENPFADGVWAPPGQYTVALTVDGQRLTQPLAVSPDPRVTLPADAYQQQFELAQRIERERVRVAAATHATRDVLVELAKLRNDAPPLARDIDIASAQLHALAGTRASANSHNAWAFPPASVQSLRYVAEALDKLERAVDGADAAPSADARAGFETVRPLAGAAVAAWSNWQRQQLPALNAKLEQAGRKPLEIASPQD